MSYSWLVFDETANSVPRRISGFMTSEEYVNNNIISFDFSQIFDIPTREVPLYYNGPSYYIQVNPSNNNPPQKQQINTWYNVGGVSEYKKRQWVFV